MRWIGKFIKFAVLAVLISGCAGTGIKSPAADTSKTISSIKSVKQFSKILGFKETNNFQESSDAGEHYMYFHKKTDIPFSNIDPKMITRQVPSTDFQESLQSLENRFDMNIKEYDFFFYRNIIYAGGTKITPAITKMPLLELAHAVLHEDWHNTADLPIHIEEASGELISVAGAYQFMGREAEIDSALESELKYWDTINEVHQKLENLSRRLKSQEIDMGAYLREREKIMKENHFLPGISVAQIAHLHSYSYYAPLINKLFDATGKDLKKTIRILRKIPRKVKKIKPRPNYTILLGLIKIFDRASYFIAHREAELRIEEYLEKVIQKLNKK